MQVLIDNPYNIDIIGFRKISVKINKLLSLNIESLSIHLLSDEEVLEINKKFLNHNYYTDVITFDLRDESSGDVEIYISLDRVKENAQNFYTESAEELCRVLIHGLLHLSGLSDNSEEDKLVMRKLESQYLDALFHVKHK